MFGLTSLSSRFFQVGTDNETSADLAIQKADVCSASSDDSKNELLRAMDLRLTALRCDLAAAFAQAADDICSTKEINDIEKFCSHVGATELRDSLCKIIEATREKCDPDSPCNKQLSIENGNRNKTISKKEENILTQPNADIPVKYGCSPAKATQVERQSASESRESSYSSEEDQQSVGRSRNLIRSASPRRAASPMRKIQIGRSGSRRFSPLIIKSLNHFPRERLITQKDTGSSDEEASEQPSKRSEGRVSRMSVQDAINLFESKQRDQIPGIQKTRTLLNASVAVIANKAVLRRWSTGIGEIANECPQECDLSPSNLGSKITNESPECDLSPRGYLVRPAKIDIKLDSPEERPPTMKCPQENAVPNQTEEISEKVSASAEWSRQKEAELNQLMMKMMETKPVKYRSAAPDASKRQSMSSEQRGGFYEYCNEKRNEKVQRGFAEKHPEKQKQSRGVQQSLDGRNDEQNPAEISANVNERVRKPNTKTQKPQKSLKHTGITKKDAPKPSNESIVKRASSKASALPGTRKSWPSTPSQKLTGVSPAKTPPMATPPAAVSTRRKSQPAQTAPRSSQKMETTQLQPKAVKSTKSDTMRAVKEVNEKKLQLLRKTTKPTKTKGHTVDPNPVSSEKPSFYSKVTKKSSVVPLEPKPFLRKSSGLGSGVSPVSKTKGSSQPTKSLRNSGDLLQSELNEIVSSSCDPVVQQLDMEHEPTKDCLDLESAIEGKNLEKSEEMDPPNHIFPCDDSNLPKMSERALNIEPVEATSIPPAAWVEMEEENEDQSVPYSDSFCQVESSPSVGQVVIPSPRVRHSLSQMLLVESSEPDVIEWGNAENPPSMVNQKDAPKGLKRLLKFARKSKTDANSTGRCSPSVFSEGEDDAEESKSTRKRSSENLLKKATLHIKNHGQQKTNLHEKILAGHGLSAQANISRSVAQSLSEKLQDGQMSASVATTKATRSFFSLPAFKGGKQNEVKI